MTSVLKKIIATCSAVAIFFSLASALCPIDAAAVPKARARTQKQVKQAPPREEPAEEEAAPPVVREAAAPADAAAKENAPRQPDAPGGANANGFNLDNYRDDEAETESYGWLIFKTIFVIGLLVGGFYYFFRFVTKKVGIQMLGRDAVQVLSVVPIGQNKYLQVVDLAGKVLVIGVSDNAISLISEITEKDQIDRIRILSNRAPSADRKVSGFQEYVMNDIGKLIDKVRELRHRDRGARTTVIDNPEDIKYLRQQRDRLKDLNGSDHE